MIGFYWEVALKLALGFLSLILVINISGKANLAPTSASDQVQNYVLGGIVGGVIYNPSVTILQFSMILLIWLALVLGLKWLKINNHAVKMFIDGKPLIIIERGQLNVEACRQAGLTAQEVSFKLRSQGIYSTKIVKRAVLEHNSQLIVVLSGEENPKFPIITDGSIQLNILELLDKEETWLLKELSDMGYTDVSDIFLAEYQDGEWNVVTY